MSPKCYHRLIKAITSCGAPAMPRSKKKRAVEKMPTNAGQIGIARACHLEIVFWSYACHPVGVHSLQIRALGVGFENPGHSDVGHRHQMGNFRWGSGPR